MKTDGEILLEYAERQVTLSRKHRRDRYLMFWQGYLDALSEMKNGSVRPEEYVEQQLAYGLHATRSIKGSPTWRPTRRTPEARVSQYWTGYWEAMHGRCTVTIEEMRQVLG
jgi:hypothetical protein